MQPLIYVADVGSIAQGNFGWARIDSEVGRIQSERERGGGEIAELVDAVAGDLGKGQPVALGFECPLFVPVPRGAQHLGKARKGEGVHPFSAGAGTGALVTGLVEAAWILRALRDRRPDVGAYLDWQDFASASGGLFLWEAFVSGGGKGADHVDDALIAATAFHESLPNPINANVIDAPSPLSLIGAALLWSGWSQDLAVLKKSCLVIKAESPVEVKRPMGKADRRARSNSRRAPGFLHDWVVRIAEQIPEGRWTAYSDVAAEIMGHVEKYQPRPQGIAAELKKDPDIVNAHRILTVDGEAPGEYPYGLELLKSEGVRFHGGRADSKQRWPKPGV